jgi:hypothetical protein
MSNVMSQKAAVFAAVSDVLGTFSGATELSTDQRKEVIASVMKGFEAGTVELSAEAAAKYDTPAKLKSYTQGLVSNWLRKDTRLNGGAKYEAKNPGSRAGTGDQTVKALRALRSTLTDNDQMAEVDAEITARLAAAKASKTKTTDINIEALPESLRHLINV